MKKTLYLMRHGETLFNVLGKVQGACDSPLTNRGIKQAEIAGHYFKQTNIVLDHAYSSTLERASDTLEIATENQLPYKRLKGIKEMNFGRFEGESSQLQPKGPATFEEFYIQFGGEAAQQVEERMVKTLTELMNQENHQNVLAVSHNGSCFYFLRSVWQGDREKMPIQFQNCCIFKYTYENKQFTLEEIIEHDFSELDTQQIMR